MLRLAPVLAASMLGAGSTAASSAVRATGHAGCQRGRRPCRRQALGQAGVLEFVGFFNILNIFLLIHYISQLIDGLIGYE